MTEFERIFNKYTVISLLVLILTMTAAACITVAVRGNGSLFSLV